MSESIAASSNHFPEERRLTTVLFADVHGFTPLAEQLDSETVSDLIKGLWRRLDKVIEAHGGYIDKHLGDGVMAIWGAPYAGDNDAEKAVNAGISLIRALDDFCQQIGIPGAELLRLRVGINSGQVFAGYVGLRNEYTVIGDAVNVAARLEQIAEPGNVVIGENTLRMVRGSFRIKRLEPTKIKGKTEQVQPYAVEGALDGSGRARYQGSDSLFTNMVGREEELKRLEEHFERAQDSTRPMMVLLNGEVGMGKSRLLLEFSNSLEAQPANNLVVLSTRGLSQTARIPFYLWRVLLRNRFGMRDDENANVASEKWKTGVNRAWGEQQDDSRLEVTQVLGALIGLQSDSNPASHENLNRICFLIRELLRRVSARKTLVLLFDDLQWADRESLLLLSHLLSVEEPPLTLFIVGAARPEFLKTQSHWHNLSRVVNINPIPFSAEMVAKAYPDLRNIPEQVLKELGSRAEGNPYFLEEVVKSLVKSGTLADNLSLQEIQSRVLSQIPESLRATLQARLDNLSREARTVALLASVVGRVFWVGAVLAAAQSAPLPGTTPMVNIPAPVLERFIQDGLRQLVRAELAFPRSGSQFSEEQEYIFKNSYLRDVAYSLIPNRNRAQFHKAVAEWLVKHQDPAYQQMAQDHRSNAERSAKASTGGLPAI